MFCFIAVQRTCLDPFLSQQLPRITSIFGQIAA
jgi:hypothetical protein